MIENTIFFSQFSCCGVNNYRQEYKYYGDGNELPGSCCENEEICSKDSEDVNKEGCADNVYTVTIATNVLLGWISLAVGAIEVSRNTVYSSWLW